MDEELAAWAHQQELEQQELEEQQSQATPARQEREEVTHDH